MLIEMNILSLCIPYHIYERNGRKLKEQDIMRGVTFFFAGRILYRGIALETSGNCIKQEEKKHVIRCLVTSPGDTSTLQ